MSADAQPRLVRFTVPGAPKGKGRHRTRVIVPKDPAKAAFAHHYADKATSVYETKIAACFRESAAAWGPPAECPVTVTIDAVLPIPKSWNKRDREDAAAGLTPARGRVDIDNYVKVVFDALNGVAWEDDRQVTVVVARKRYGVIPGLKVQIEAVASEASAATSPTPACATGT